MPGKENTTYTNTWFYGINRNSKRKDAAMEFLTWLTQPSIERDLLLDKTKNEVVAVQNANLIDAAVNQRFEGMHKAAAQSLKGAHGVPLFAQWPQFSDLLEATINELASGQGDVKAALDNAAQRARRIMRS
jgi:ABC-type glycerol-3-phosphate transport system substrate-binding protein